MLVKKLGLLLVLVLFLVSLASPASARRSCSGDDCGCGLAAQECREACGPVWSCVSACNKQSIQCSKACCGILTR